ncbi:MAG: glycoside hydrolase family 76 protein, partial [Candidatus Bathyarchaeota archaeon]
RSRIRAPVNDRTAEQSLFPKMGEGGIYDKEEGGFFRYSTTNDWSIPHYEKMCEDNAKLLINYLEANQITGEISFKNKAKDVLKYIDSKLSNKEIGGFYGSQDADEVYYKLKLLERSRKIPPKIDQTIFSDWNAMMSSAYLLASIVLEDQKYQKFAFKTIEYLLKMFNPKKGIKHYFNEQNHDFSGLLTDHAYMTKCLIDIYQITSNQKFLDIAEKFAEFMIKNLWDETGGFFDKTKETNDFGALKHLDKPLGENSIAAEAFLKLHHLTNKTIYFEKAKKTLNYFGTIYQRYGIMAASYGLTMELYLHPMKIHIIGSKKDEMTQQFLTESLKTYNPLKVIEIIDPDKNSKRLETLGYPKTEEPTTYVCYEGTCKSIKTPIKIN